MSKPIPTATPKTKKKKRLAEITKLVDPKAQKKVERQLQGFLMELDKKAETRESYVQAILAVNDESIEEIVQTMVEQLRKMQGAPRIVFEGQTYNAIKGETEMLTSIQTRNFRWIAVRCLVACAEWDIRIGNFTLPTDKCARCAVPVKRKRKKIPAKVVKAKKKGRK